MTIANIATSKLLPVEFAAAERVLIIGQGFIGKNLLADDDRVFRCGHVEALAALNFYKPTIIINCAFDPQGYKKELTIQDTLDRLLLTKVASLRARYVYLSTRAVYAPESQMCATEESLLRPISAYGKNKLLIEQLVQETLDASKILLLRLPNVFGLELDEQRDSFFKIFLNNLILKNEIILEFAPDTVKDFIHIQDLQELMVALLLNKLHGIYNVSYGVPISCSRLIQLTKKKFTSVAVKLKIDELGEEFYLNSDKLKNALRLKLDETKFESAFAAVLNAVKQVRS